MKKTPTFRSPVNSTVEIDKSVATTYGWTDLNLGHGFHETKQGIRFTISEAARREVLGQLAVEIES